MNLFKFKDKDNIIFIALPYDIILENIEYQWFNNHAQDQFYLILIHNLLN